MPAGGVNLFHSYGRDAGIIVTPIYGGQEYGRQIRSRLSAARMSLLPRQVEPLITLIAARSSLMP